MMIGMANAARSPPEGFAEVRPTPEMVATARSIPRSMAPESPMKIRAGLKFHGRNPTAEPATIAARSAAVDAWRYSVCPGDT